MRIVWAVSIILLSSLTPRAMSAQQTGAGGGEAIVTQLDHQLSFVEREVVAAAEAMPESKYSFTPTGGNFKGVRNFAQQVKHIAIGNYHIYGPIIPDDSQAGTGDKGTAVVQTKEQILKYLRDSFVFAHRAIAAINSQNMLLPVKHAPNRAAATPLELAVFGCSHGSDIYGQMVEYLRMNAIVPPASVNSHMPLPD
jgi:DinB superfamily